MGCSHSTRVHHSNGRPRAAPSALKAWLPSRDLLTEPGHGVLESTESKDKRQEHRGDPAETLAEVCSADSEVDGSAPPAPGPELGSTAVSTARSSSDESRSILPADATGQQHVAIEAAAAEGLRGVPGEGGPLPVDRCGGSPDAPLPGAVASEEPGAGIADDSETELAIAALCADSLAAAPPRGDGGPVEVAVGGVPQEVTRGHAEESQRREESAAGSPPPVARDSLSESN